MLSFGPVWSCVLENIFPFTGFEIDMLELTEAAGRLEVDYDELDRLTRPICGAPCTWLRKPCSA